MTRAALAGWLLVTGYGGTIAWYETEADCKVALQYVGEYANDCVPDRHAVEAMRTKP
jgi:hypothetical protein